MAAIEGWKPKSDPANDLKKTAALAAPSTLSRRAFVRFYSECVIVSVAT